VEKGVEGAWREREMGGTGEGGRCDTKIVRQNDEGEGMRKE